MLLWDLKLRVCMFVPDDTSQIVLTCQFKMCKIRTIGLEITEYV